MVSVRGYWRVVNEKGQTHRLKEYKKWDDIPTKVVMNPLTYYKAYKYMLEHSPEVKSDSKLTNCEFFVNMKGMKGFKSWDILVGLRNKSESTLTFEDVEFLLKEKDLI